jgi:hypothetical protein
MTSWKLERCSDVAPVPVEWLWPRYLARGKLAVLDGDPEQGKSLLTIDLIARLGIGRSLPDGSTGPAPAAALLLSAEDDVADTVRPRAEAAGANLDRLLVPSFGDRLPRLPADIPALEDLITTGAAALVVIDPFLAFVPPEVSANLDQCVRQVLTPLAGLAARTNCAVLLVRHLSKAPRRRAAHRGQGSMGIVAACRTALFATPAPAGGPATHALCVSKTNMGHRPPALGYRIVDAPCGRPVIEWTGPIAANADDLSTDAAPLRPRDRAIDWLRHELANGPRKVAELYADAAAQGIPEKTLERAKSELGATAQRIWNRTHDRGEWYWFDPSQPWPKDAPFKKPFELEPLDPLE